MCSHSANQAKVVLVRHAESEWNAQNRLAGWVDVNLTERGEQQAIQAGKNIKEAGYQFDVAFTSALTRAQLTLDAILLETGQSHVKIVRSWKLNECHFGEITGLTKNEVEIKYSKVSQKIWPRNYDMKPPPMQEDHPFYKRINGREYFDVGLRLAEIPKSESLKMVAERSINFWEEVIVPEIKSGKTVLVVGHAGSLKGIVKYLDKLSDEEFVNLTIPNARPFLYALDENFDPLPSGGLQFLDCLEGTIRENDANKP